MVQLKVSNSLEKQSVFYRKTGRNIIEKSPVFSLDGESVLLIVENKVRVYNIKTAYCARTLETQSNVKELVAVQFLDDESYNLYGCSTEGLLTVWSWEQGGVLRDVQLKLPIGLQVETFHMLNNSTSTLTGSNENSGKLFIGIFSNKTGDCIWTTNNNVHYNGTVSSAVGWFKNEQFLVVSNGSNRIYLQNLENQKSLFLRNFNNFRVLSVATHKTDGTVAFTDTSGKVTVLRGNLFDPRGIAREVLHWHYLPPMSLCFSVQGSYIYSGGMENVLIKWTVGNLANHANEKSFLPRLPGAVRHVATNNAHVAIALSNNSVVIANAELRVVSTILECGGLSPVARAVGAALVFHRPLGALLMGGRTGHLQLYSTTTDKVLYNVDITEMNKIPPTRSNLFPLEMEIVCAAVSADGSWLATSEYRNDGINYPEERLKFWAVKTNSESPFKLNTCVNLSHGGCNVVSLAFSNKGEFCVSAGNDKKFRIWKKEKTVLDNKKKTSWSCLTACYYSSGIAETLANDVLNKMKIGDSVTTNEINRRDMFFPEKDRKYDALYKIYNMHKEQFSVDEKLFRGVSDELEMGGVAISQDGSLIAAWFGCKLTLWDTHLCNLRTTLSHPALRPKGVHVQFGNGDAAHYLACSTESCVAVWSLLSLSIKWIVKLNATCLVADQFSNKMAVVTNNNDVYVFTPHNSTPILTRKRLLDPSTGVFKQCTFGFSTSKNDITLYLMRNNSEIYCLEPEQVEDISLEVLSRRNAPVSNFSAMLAEQQLSAVRPLQGGDVTQLDTELLGNNAVLQFLSAAPHMMPPVSLLTTPFLQYISGFKEDSQVGEETSYEAMDVDDSSSDDDDEIKPHAPKTTELLTVNYEQVNEKRLHRLAKEVFVDLDTTSFIFGV